MQGKYERKNSHTHTHTQMHTHTHLKRATVSQTTMKRAPSLVSQ